MAKRVGEETRTKRVLITLLVTALVLAIVIGVFQVVIAILSPPEPPSQRRINTLYGVYLSEEWQQKYYAKNTDWLVGTGTRFYVYEAGEDIEALEPKLQEGPNEVVEEAYAFWIKDLKKSVPEEYVPDFANQYRWTDLEYRGRASLEEEFLSNNHCFALVVYQSGRVFVIERFV